MLHDFFSSNRIHVTIFLTIPTMLKGIYTIHIQLLLNFGFVEGVGPKVWLVPCKVLFSTLHTCARMVDRFCLVYTNRVMSHACHLTWKLSHILMQTTLVWMVFWVFVWMNILLVVERLGWCPTTWPLNKNKAFEFFFFRPAVWKGTRAKRLWALCCRRR